MSLAWESPSLWGIATQVFALVRNDLFLILMALSIKLRRIFKLFLIREICHPEATFCKEGDAVLRPAV